MNYEQMTLEKLKMDLIVDAKKGYPFLLVGELYWFVMGVLSFWIEDHRLLALCYLSGSGSICPLAVVISKILKANILSKNPLGVLRPLKKSKKTRFQNYVGILSFFSYNYSNKKEGGYNATKTTNNDFKSIYRNL